MNDLLSTFNTGGIRSEFHFLAAKRAAGRPQDQGDILFLEELQRPGKLP